MPANALIGLVFEKTHLTSFLLLEKSRKNLRIPVLAVLELMTFCLGATLLNQLGHE